MQTPNSRNVGDEVFVCRPGTYRTSSTLGQVSKISPSGQMTISFGEGREPLRFNANGREIGGDSYRSAYLDWNVAERRAAIHAEQTKEAAVSAIRKVETTVRGGLYYRPGKEELVAEVERLEALVAAARAAVEAM